MRIVSWNVNWRTGLARDQGRLLRELNCGIVILQEVNRKSAEVLRDAAGLAWMIVSEAPAGSTVPRHQRLVAVGGTGISSANRLDLEAPVGERVLAVKVTIAGRHATVVSYHAPPGVNWGRVKVDQALAVTHWLCERTGPMILGADANTPKLDPIDDAAVRTHWHTGSRRVNGGRGDDELWGPSARHRLKDCLRTWLAADPTERLTLTPTDRSRSRTTRGSARRTLAHLDASTRSGSRPTSRCAMCSTSRTRSVDCQITPRWSPTSTSASAI